MTRISIYVAFLALVAIATPFYNFVYYNSNQEGVFGFAWMSSFAFAIIPVFSYLSFGLLLDFYGSKTQFKKSAKLLSVALLSIGCFYFLFTFRFGKNDFPKEYYYYIISILSIILVGFVYLAHLAILKAERRLIKIIHILLSGYYKGLEKETLISPWKIKQFKKFRTQITEKIARHEQL